MKNPHLYKILGIILLFILSNSCTSKLDFNQVNDIKLTPVYETNLAYFDVPAKDFVTNGIELNVFEDKVNFNPFRDDFFKTNLKKTELFFEINNTINRAFIVDLYALDANNVVLESFQFNVPAYSGVENLVKKTEVFENTRLDLLKKMTKLGFKITLQSGTALTESSLGSIKLRSSATIYLEVQ